MNKTIIVQDTEKYVGVSNMQKDERLDDKLSWTGKRGYAKQINNLHGLYIDWMLRLGMRLELKIMSKLQA